MSAADAFVTFSVSVERAAFQLWKFGDKAAESDKDPGQTTYTGPCVCDVCPCPLQIVHRSGTTHCWNCAKGSHWSLGPVSVDRVSE
jgi:hypothetical protein